MLQYQEAPPSWSNWGVAPQCTHILSNKLTLGGTFAFQRYALKGFGGVNQKSSIPLVQMLPRMEPESRKQTQ